MRKIYWLFIIIFFVIIGLEVFSSKSVKNTSLSLDTIQAASVISESVWTENSFASQTKPDTITWKLLGIIKYVKKPAKDYPEGVMFPIINSSLKEKNKKKIAISGFIIPIDNVSYALSKNVFASCFFCGQAGPETIMGIKFKGTTPKLKTDQFVTLEGVFRYNDNDVNDWIYHIDDAVIVKGK
jgi:hypothetical protein